MVTVLPIYLIIWYGSVWIALKLASGVEVGMVVEMVLLFSFEA